MPYFFLFKQLWHYAAGHRWKIVVMVFFHVISLSATILTPYVFAQILNTLQTGNRDEILRRVTTWTFIWVGLSIWFNVFHRLARYFEFDAAFRAQQAFTNEYYNIVTHLPLRWHSDHHSGETINRINMAGAALGSFGAYQFIYINHFISFWGPLLALSFLSWKISLLSFIMAVVSMILVRRFDKRLAVLYREVNDLRHKFSATFFDYISNIRTIITLRVAAKTAVELNKRMETTYSPHMEAETWVNAWKWFIISLSTTALRIGVVFYYVWLQLAKDGRILVGNAAAVFQYLGQLTDTYMNIAREYQQLIQWHTNFLAVMPIADEQQHAYKRGLANDDWKQIAIHDLHFAYQDGRQTLDHIALTFTRGETIALIGTSGAGKSSLMTILRGLYTPETMHMTIDGVAQSDAQMLHETTTLIPQDPEIFENTILFNITMGADYSAEQIDKVIALARFDDVLRKLPHGLDTDMREKGVTLSGGEKQRLALARGLLAAENSSLILMDEPTSSVDMANEKAIYTSIFKLFSDRTIISSVHRVSLLPLFDRIIVMENGRIIEQGHYNDLTQNTGSYFAAFLQKLAVDENSN